MRARVVACLLFCLAMIPGSLAQQQAVVVRGRVTAAEDGKPLRNATVALGSPVNGRSARTDANGNFELTVSDSRLTLSISKPGYVRASVGRPSVPGQVNVSLVRGGVLTVYVVNAAGQPVPGGEVLVTCSNGGGSGQTDDLGRRRVSGIPAGQCTVSTVSPRPAPLTLRPGPNGSVTAVPNSAAVVQTLVDRQKDGVKVDVRAGEEASIVVTKEGSSAPPGLLDTAPTTGSGSIRGRVLDAAGRPLADVAVIAASSVPGRPLADVAVMAVSGPARQAAVTGGDGGFALTNLPPSTYAVQVRAPGYVPRDAQNGAAGQLLVAVAEGQQATADVAMVRGGVITGRIVDEYGEPLEDVQVQAMRADGTSASAPPGVPVAGMMTGMIAIRSDDRGQYRIAGLAPGSYRIAARVNRGGSDEMVFYPGARAADGASPVVATADVELAGIDINAGLTGGALTGRITLSSGQVPAGGVVRLTPVGGVASAMTTPAASIRREGEFSFPDVAPGSYELMVSAAPSYVIVTHRSGQPLGAAAVPPNEFRRATVTVSGTAASRVDLQTVPGSILRGDVVFEGEHASVLPSQVKLAAMSDPVVSAVPDANWSFELRDLSIETRIGLTSGPKGWWIKSVMVGGTNAAEEKVDFANGAHSSNGVRVVLARTVTIAGTVTDPNGIGGAGSVRAVAFPVERDRRYTGSRYLRSVIVGTDGRYALDVPPGQYWVIAVAAPEAPTEAVMAQLESLAKTVFASETSGARHDMPIVRLPR